MVASKLYADSITTLKDILESDSVSFVSAAKKIYSDRDISFSQTKLNNHLDEMKTRMKADNSKTQDWINKIKNDKVGTDKYLYIVNITEEKYKNDTLLLSKQEISILPADIQSMITEKIENQFYYSVGFRFLVLRINSEYIDIDKCIDEYAEICKYFIKFYKDREIIHKYSQKVSKQSLPRSILAELI